MTQDPFANFPPAFPRPDWDDETLGRVIERRRLLQDGCPRHFGNAHSHLTFYKELFINDPATGTHVPATAFYADGCMIKGWRLDMEHEEPKYEQAPKG